MAHEWHLVAALADQYKVPLFWDPDELVAFATEFGASYAPPRRPPDGGGEVALTG